MSNYKNKEIFPEILKLLDIPEIIVIHGSRQVGKTTLMKMVIENLEKHYNQDIFYFDLEREEFLNLANLGAEEVIKYIKRKKKRAGKIFYEHYKDDFKLMVSGSSSFAIKSKFKNSLVGRTIKLEIIEKYIYRDIKDLKKFNNLLRFLVAQVGDLLNVSELANSLNMARQTVYKYLFILEQTYIIKLIQFFSKNIRSELSNMKNYSLDLAYCKVMNKGESRLDKIKQIYPWQIEALEF